MINLINKYYIFHYSSLVVFSSFFLFYSGSFGLFAFNVSCSDSTDLDQVFALSSIALTPTLSDIKLYPNYVTGFVDGEGCFSLGVSPSKVQAVCKKCIFIRKINVLSTVALLICFLHTEWWKTEGRRMLKCLIFNLL